MKRVFVLIIITLFLTIPFTTALSVSNFRFFSDDREITSFRYDEDYTVDMQFDATDARGGVTIYKDDFGSASGPLHSDCPDGVCTYEGIMLTPLEAGIVASFTDNVGSVEQTVSFTRDVSEPTLVEIAPVDCERDQCYFGPESSLLKAEIQGSVAGFDDVNIRIGQTQFSPESCDSTGCLYDVSTFAGRTGTAYDVLLEEDAEDLSGNLIAIKETPDQLIYDNKVPRVTSVTASSEGFAGVVYSPSTVNIEVEVEEDSPGTVFLTFTPDTEDLLPIEEEGECSEPVNGIVSCLVPLVLDGVRSYRAVIGGRFVDAAGNEKELRSTNIRVLEGVEGEEVPDLWEIDSTVLTPNRLNRATLGLFDKTVYHYMDLKPKRSSVEITSINVRDCHPLDPDSESTVSDPFGIMEYIMNNQYGTTNPIVYYRFKQLMEYPDVDSFSYSCNLEIFSRQGRKFYVNPELEEYNFTLGFYESPTFADNVQAEKDRVLAKQLKMQEQYGDLRDNMERLLYVCNTLITMDAMGAPLGGTAAALKAGTITAAAGEAVSRVEAGMSDTAGNILDNAGLYKVCQMMTCTAPWQQEMKEHILGAIGFGQFDFNVHVSNDKKTVTLEGQGAMANLGISTFGDVAGIGENLFVDAATFCIPGLLTHLKKYEAIDCGYLECLDRDATAGFPVSECVATRGYQECRFVTGELWNMFPFAQMFSKMVNFVNEMLRDPIAVLGLVARCVCMDPLNKAKPPGSWLCLPFPPAGTYYSTDFCQVFLQVKAWTKIISFINSMRTIFEGPQTDTYCSAVLEQVNGENRYDFSYDPTSTAQCSGKHCTITLATRKDLSIMDGNLYQSALARTDLMQGYNTLVGLTAGVSADANALANSLSRRAYLINSLGKGRDNYLLNRDQSTNEADEFQKTKDPVKKVEATAKIQELAAKQRYFEVLGLSGVYTKADLDNLFTKYGSHDGIPQLTESERKRYEAMGLIDGDGYFDLLRYNELKAIAGSNDGYVFLGAEDKAIPYEVIYQTYDRIVSDGGAFLVPGDFKGSREEMEQINGFLAAYQMSQLGLDVQGYLRYTGGLSGKRSAWDNGNNNAHIIAEFAKTAANYNARLQTYDYLKDYESLHKDLLKAKTDEDRNRITSQMSSLKTKILAMDSTVEFAADGSLKITSKTYKKETNKDGGAKEEFKAAEDKFNDLKKEAAVIAMNMMTDPDTHEMTFKTGWAMYKDMVDTVKGFHTISTFFYKEQDFGAWSETIDRIMSYVNVEEMLYSKVCDSEFDREVGTDGMVVNTDGGFLHPALHVEAEMEEHSTPDGETFYDYVITTQSVTRNIDPGVSLTVSLDDDKVLYTQDNFTASMPLDRGKHNPIVAINETREYEKACVKFSRDLEDLFDWTDISGNKFCADILTENRVEREDETS